MENIKAQIKKVQAELKKISFADECNPGSEDQAIENQECVQLDLQEALKATDLDNLTFWIEEAVSHERRGGSIALYTEPLLAGIQQ